MARYEIIMDVDDPRFERVVVDGDALDYTYDEDRLVFVRRGEDEKIVFMALASDVLFTRELEEDEDAESPSLDAG